MKKLLFILCVSFLIGNAFATETESDIKESTTLELASSSYYAESTRCCRKTITDPNTGDSWSARRCVTHDNTHIAMGRACELALADAKKAKRNAASYTLITVE